MGYFRERTAFKSRFTCGGNPEMNEEEKISEEGRCKGTAFYIEKFSTGIEVKCLECGYSHELSAVVNGDLA
jgi:hypothetical protein